MIHAIVYAIHNNQIGIITDIEAEITKRVFDFDVTNFKGVCSNNLELAVYVIMYKDNKLLYSGLINSIKQESGGVEFKVDDFRKLLNSEVLLDFSQAPPDLTLNGIFTKTMEAVISTFDTMISKIPINYIIPADTTSTIEIADYTHDYIIVNAWDFLKVYLAFYSYYISVNYNNVLNRIEFEFKKQSTTLNIRLEDFIFDKITIKPKTNKAIATIKFEDNTTGTVNTWNASTETYWNSQLPADRGTFSTLPSPSNFSGGYAARVSAMYEWIEIAPTTRFDIDDSVLMSGTTCPTNTVALSDAINHLGNAGSHPTGTIARLTYFVNTPTPEFCAGTVAYFQQRVSLYNYHVLIENVIFLPRPNFVEKVYILGNDNVIYSGYPNNNLRLYPVKTKIFEEAFLSKAQFKAVLSLVESRYNENIIIHNVNAPLDLKTVELYTMVRIFDKTGEVKILPVSQIIFKENRHSLKLGFKKEFLTEIITVKE